MPPIEYIRVRATDTKNEKSIPAESSMDGWEVIDKPATSADGQPLPDKPHTELKKAAPKSLSGQSGQPAETSKEK